MNTDTTAIDDRADRLHDRWQAFMLYVNDAFRIAAVARGYESGHAEAIFARRDVSFEAQRFDGQAFAMEVSRYEIEDIADRHAVDPFTRTQIEAEIESAIAGLGPRRQYTARWAGEKNGAAEVAKFVADHLPRIERPAPSVPRGGIPSLAEFMRYRKATPDLAARPLPPQAYRMPDEAARLRLARFRGPNWEPMLETSAADKVAHDCACVACERDGQHAPHCAVHEEPTAPCDCPQFGSAS